MDIFYKRQHKAQNNSPSSESHELDPNRLYIQQEQIPPLMNINVQRPTHSFLYFPTGVMKECKAVVIYQIKE